MMILNDDFISVHESFHFISFLFIPFRSSLVVCSFVCKIRNSITSVGFIAHIQYVCDGFFSPLLMLMIVLKLIIFLRASCLFYGSCFAHESEIKFFLLYIWRVFEFGFESLVYMYEC